MPNFIQLTSTTDVTYTLAGPQTGFVGEGVTIARGSGAVVSATGLGPKLTVNGTIYAAAGTAIVAEDIDIVIGAQGSVFADNGPGVILLQAGTITNYGTIYNSSFSTAIVKQGASVVHIVNHGRIARADPVGNYVIEARDTGELLVDNFGVIDGNVGAESTVLAFRLRNIGTINGEVVDSGVRSTTMVNSGLITRAVSLNGGDDVFDGRDGRVLGLLSGGAGDDKLFGGAGNDTIDGGSENDTIDGSAGNDSIDGGADNDSIEGGAGRDNLVGGSGFDRLFGGVDDDTIDGGDGIDSLLGGDGDDQLFGGSDAGSDTIDGGAGVDTIFGGGGNDFIRFDVADLRFGFIDAGTGFDTLFNTDETTAITVFLGNFNAENYFGSAARETVVAAVNGGTLFGGDGDDQLEGSAVNDELSGATGDDLVNGYAGNDFLFGGWGQDYMIGGAGNDSLRGEIGNDTLFGGDDGDFSLDGGDGNDVVMGEAGNDTIYGGNGDDVWLSGGDGNDVIEGGAGNDLVRGEAGNDPWLNGGAGNDTIIGGAGADNLVGDTGADQFQFYSAAEAGDTIFGFVSGTDKLFIAQSGFGQLTGYIANAAPAPINAGPHLLYNTTTGVLTYDANGTIAGGQTVLATLSGAPTLLYEDLLFV